MLIDNPQIFEWIKIILTAILGIFAGLIALLQYKLNQYKIRLDLYEKRYAIYLGYKQTIATVLKYGTLQDDELREYEILTNASSFLFEEDIVSHFSEVYSKFVKIIQYQSQIKNNSLIYEQYGNDTSQILTYFRQLILEADKKYFDKYLNFSKLKY